MGRRGGPPFAALKKVCLYSENALVKLFGNDEQHFNPGAAAILHGGPELPLLERAENKLGLRKRLREDDAESLEAAGLIDKAVDHEGVGINCAGIEVRADDVVGPGRLKMRSIASGVGIRDIKDPDQAYDKIRALVEARNV